MLKFHGLSCQSHIISRCGIEYPVDDTPAHPGQPFLLLIPRSIVASGLVIEGPHVSEFQAQEQSVSFCYELKTINIQIVNFEIT